MADSTITRWRHLESLGDCVALAAALAGTALARSAVAPDERNAWILAVPTLVTLAPLLTPRRLRATTRVVLGILFLALSILASMSVGLLFMPAAVLMLCVSAGRLDVQLWRRLHEP